MDIEKKSIDFSQFEEKIKTGSEIEKLDIINRLRSIKSSQSVRLLNELLKDNSIKVRNSANLVLKNNSDNVLDKIKGYFDDEVIYWIIIPLIFLFILGLFAPTIPAFIFYFGFTYVVLYVSIKFDKSLAIPLASFIIFLSLILHVSGVMLNYKPTLLTMITQLMMALMVSVFMSQLREEKELQNSTILTLRNQLSVLKEVINKKKKNSNQDSDMNLIDKMKKDLKEKSRKTLEIVTQLNQLISERSSDGVIQRIVKIFKFQLSINRFSIWFIDDVKHELYPIYNSENNEKLSISVPLIHNTIITKVVKEGGFISLDELKKDPAEFEKIEPVKNFPTTFAIVLEGVDKEGKSKKIGAISIEDVDIAEKLSFEDIELIRGIARNSSYALSWSGDLELARSDLENIKEISEKERNEKKKIKNLFGKFVAPAVVEEIIKNPEYISLGGKRRHITIFFADIRGFTAMSETMADEPEKVIEIVNLFLSTMTNVIINKGGTLDKYMGDALMAIFGAPISRSDDAYRAVEAAVVIKQETKKLWEKLMKTKKLSVNVGIGINSGEAVVGMVGSHSMMNYTAIGDSVNVASRIESKAKGGQILISKETYEKVKEYVKAKELPPITVKGKSKPIPVYEVEDLTDMFLI